LKLVLLGAHGQVGRAVAPLLGAMGPLAAFGHTEADLDQPESVAALLRHEAPDVIVNAAAYTAVDAAEDDAARAHRINGEAVAAIGEVACGLGALVVHYSTDFVFDGRADRPYVETDAADPLSVYGRSKLAGDLALAASGADHLILRVSWTFSPSGKNFPLAILNLARTRSSLDVVADETGAATSAGLIAAATIEALRQTLPDRGKAGLYHVAASGSASRHELAQFIVAEARAAGANLALGADGVRPTTAAAFGAKAPRPANSRLDTTKFRTAFGMMLPTWQDEVRSLVATLKEEERL
jgi:dTDP-4-dehydrorhamnose reductase